MRSILTPLFAAALLVQASFAFAQEATDETTPAETAPADDGLALGEPVGPQPGEPYIRETFDDWALRCIKAPEGERDPCNLYQLLMNETGLAVAEFNFFRLPEGGRAAAGANVVVPLETLLTQQLTMSVDGANTRRYPFTFCNAAGCVARIGFTPEEVDQLKRGAQATLRLVPAAAPTEQVVLTLSLKGFTAGYESTAATGNE